MSNPGDSNDGVDRMGMDDSLRKPSRRQVSTLLRLTAIDEGSDEVMTRLSQDTQDHFERIIPSEESQQRLSRQVTEQIQQLPELKQQQTVAVLGDRQIPTLQQEALIERHGSQQYSRAQLKGNQIRVLLQDCALSRLQQSALELAATDSRTLQEGILDFPESQGNRMVARQFRRAYSDDLDTPSIFSRSVSTSTDSSGQTPRRIRYMRRQTTPATPVGDQTLHQQVVAALMERPGAYSMRGSMMVERNEPAYLMQQNSEVTNEKTNLQEISLRLEGSRRVAEDAYEMISSRCRNEVDASMFSDDESNTEGLFNKGKSTWSVSSMVLTLVAVVTIVLASGIGLFMGLRHTMGSADGVSGTNVMEEEDPSLSCHDIIATCKPDGRIDISILSLGARQRRAEILREYADNTPRVSDGCLQPENLVATCLALSRTPTTETRFTLGVFFFSVGGSTWARFDNWLSGKDECDWFGIECNSNRHVVEINLPNNLLKGELPPLGNLSSLTSLRLSMNDLRGGLPLEGTTSWEVLDLRFNRINESFSKIVTSLPRVKELDLSENSIFGPLSEVSSLPSSLEVLGLEGNHGLFGVLEPGMFPSSKIRVLELADMPNLKGTIPHGVIRSLSTLEVLNFELTGLEGSLPEEIWELPSMEKLFLGSSLLSGTIPSSAFLNNSNWEKIDLRNSGFWGTLPTAIGRLTKLEELTAVETRISGPIPTTIGLCTSLRLLHFRSAYLTSTIPSELGLLTNLETLGLLHNYLTGTIPSELGKIQSLKRLLLSQNGKPLTGTVPKEICKIAGLNEMTLTCYSDLLSSCQCCTDCDLNLISEVNEPGV